MIAANIYSAKLKPNSAWLAWLTYTKMLTTKLHAISKDTNLTVLQSSVCPPKWWDRYVLGIENKNIFNREIIISAHASACWYARTIIPIKTYNKHTEIFTRLEKESLGDLIFGNNGIKRKSLQHYCINKHNIEYHWLPSSIANTSKNLWLRLSEFTILQDKFYLVEIFLPEMEKYI